MQINSVTTSQVIPVVKTTPTQAAVPTSETSDKAVLNFSANSFSSLVQEASNMPDVRSEVVDAYKARIHAGHYPSQDVIAGLTKLIGGGIVQAAKPGSAAAASPTSSSTED